MTDGVGDADGNGSQPPDPGNAERLSDVHRAAETTREAMERAAAADTLRRTTHLTDVLSEVAASIEFGVGTMMAQAGSSAAAAPEAWRPGEGARGRALRRTEDETAPIGMLSPVDLEALARIHGPRQGARGPGSVLNADTIARALTRAAGAVATVVPPSDGSDLSRHPIGENLRIVYHVPSETSEIQRRMEGRWSAIETVAISGHPEMGFEIDRAALERVVGPLAPDLHAALSGLGVGVSAVPRPYDTPSIHVAPDRAALILDGVRGHGGGHRAGTGLPGRTEFPQEWSDDRILEALVDVARGGAVTERTRSGAALVEGAVRGVLINVVVGSDGSIGAGWPVSGPGVTRNPRW